MLCGISVIVVCSLLTGLPSVLWAFDTVGRSSERAPGLRKLSDEVLVWFSVWSEVQIVCIWSSCNATVIHKPHNLLPDKSWLVLPFWYRLTQVFVEKRPLDGCSSSSSSSCCCCLLTGSRLHLVLNAEEYDYMDNSPAAGLHLVFHRRTEDSPQLIFDDDRRDIVLTAGTRNVITVRVCFIFLNFTRSPRSPFPFAPPFPYVFVVSKLMFSLGGQFNERYTFVVACRVTIWL